MSIMKFSFESLHLRRNLLVEIFLIQMLYVELNSAAKNYTLQKKFFLNYRYCAYVTLQ